MYKSLSIQNLSKNKWLRNFLTYALPIALFSRFLIRKPLGFLLLLLAIYYYMFFFSELKPWTFNELLLWIDELGGEVKASVLSSLLTIFGFLVAFQVASEGWKIQALGQLKLRLAEELDTFFVEASSLTITMTVFTAQAVEAVKMHRANGANNETNFGIEHIIQRTPEFLDARRRLSTMGVFVHRIAGSNYSLLAGVPGAMEFLNTAIGSLSKITEAMWITIPRGIPQPDIQEINAFSQYADISEFQTFIDNCEMHRAFIDGSIGAVRSILMSPVVAPNLNTFINNFKNRHQINRMFSDLNKAMHQKS